VQAMLLDIVIAKHAASSPRRSSPGRCLESHSGKSSGTIVSLGLMNGAFRWLVGQFVVFGIFMLIGMVSQKIGES
jgi:hypothetical protein